MGLFDAAFFALPNGLRQKAVRRYLIGIRLGVDAFIQTASQAPTGITLGVRTEIGK